MRRRGAPAPQQIAELFDTSIPREFLEDETPRICEDCGNLSDLGRKCRDCYDLWQDLLWQDIGKHHRTLLSIARALNQVPPEVTLAIAHGKPGGLKGSHAELHMRVQRALEGPFAETLSAKLEAIRLAASTATKGRSRAASAEVD